MSESRKVSKAVRFYDSRYELLITNYLRIDKFLFISKRIKIDFFSPVTCRDLDNIHESTLIAVYDSCWRVFAIRDA